jgi:hypothetical protein
MPRLIKSLFLASLFLANAGASGAQGAVHAPGHTQEPKRPNFVFIMTDDQDLHLNSLDYMPKLKQVIADEGTVFQRHFCTIAVCCPSRVSLMTGKLAHNTNVTDVVPPYGRRNHRLMRSLQKWLIYYRWISQIRGRRP